MADTDGCTSEGSVFEINDNSHKTEVVRKRVTKEKIRAKSAKDLVKRQEELVAMLQKMRSDLSKMDREASHIKEDVVRSNQILNITVHKKEAHHLTPSLDGFNLSYALPRVTYKFQARTLSESSMRHLNQLSSFWPSSSSSRRSSVSSQCKEQSLRERRLSHRLAARSAFVKDDCYSGTESDREECNTSVWSSQNSDASSISHGSSESQTEAAGSSTESTSTFNHSGPEVNPRMLTANRKPSYFYVQDNRSDEEVFSDTVEV